MKLENIRIYDMEEGFKASKYPMSLDTESVNGDITDRIKILLKVLKGKGMTSSLQESG